MQIQCINKKELESLKLIGSGFESKVYLLDDNKAIKIFSLPILQNIDKVTSKRKKICELYSINDDYMPKIFSLIYDEKNNFIGYSMEYFKNVLDFNQVFSDSQICIKEKINLYKLLEEKVLSLAKKNIFMVDNNFRNFCIDR